MSLRRKLFASLEELPVEGTVAGDGQITESVVAIDDVSRQTMEVNDAAEELEAAEFEQEELGEVAEALESLIADATGSLESGGLDATAAHFAYKAANFALGRIGHQIQVPSAESFGGSASRLKQTTVSVEGWKETLKSIWDAILNGLTKLSQMIQKFFVTKLSEAAFIKRRADAIKAKVAKEAPKTGEITVSAKKLHIGGKLLTNGAELSKALQTTTNVTVKMAMRVKDSNEYLDKVISGLGSLSFDADDKFQESLKSPLELIKQGIPNDKFANFGEASGDVSKLKEGGMTVRESDELLGGKRIRIISSEGKEGSPKEILEAFRKQRVFVDSVSEAPKEDGKMAALDKRQIEEIASVVSNAMGEIIKRKTDFESVAALAKKVKDIGSKLAGSTAKAESLNAENKELVSSLAKAVQHVATLANQSAKAVSDYSSGFATAVLDLCDKSFKAKAADEKKADEPAKAAEPAAAGA